LQLSVLKVLTAPQEFLDQLIFSLALLELMENLSDLPHHLNVQLVHLENIALEEKHQSTETVMLVMSVL